MSEIHQQIEALYDFALDNPRWRTGYPKPTKAKYNNRCAGASALPRAAYMRRLSRQKQRELLSTLLSQKRMVIQFNNLKQFVLFQDK